MTFRQTRRRTYLRAGPEPSHETAIDAHSLSVNCKQALSDRDPKSSDRSSNPVGPTPSASSVQQTLSNLESITVRPPYPPTRKLG